jgi:glutathione S-transferase
VRQITSVRVHRIPFSANVERVALALAHKGLEAEWVDHDPADRSAIRALSGQDLVPVLQTGDGTVLHDSPAILLWLEERHPDPPLLPREPARREEVLVFCDWFNRVWKRPPNLLAERPDDPRAGEWAAELTGSLARFEALLDGRDHLLGDAFGLADVTAFPFLKHGLGPADPDDADPFHALLREHLTIEPSHPRLAAWIGRIENF